MQWLPKCLEQCAPYNLIVVDNASTDGTVEYIKTHFKHTLLLEQDKNQGFGQANNIGISVALKKGADCVFLLNQDVYLHSGCIDKLVDIQQQHPEFGILSPIHLNGSGDKLDEKFAAYVDYTGNADFYSDFVLKKPLQEMYEVSFVNAAGWLLSRDILETVGGFDPIFFHYGEDENYCHRAKFHGFKIGVASKAFMNHDRQDRADLQVMGMESPRHRQTKLMVHYANINLDNRTELLQLYRKRKRAFIKTFLRLKFSGLASSRFELKLIENTLEETESSRIKNAQPGIHYLET